MIINKEDEILFIHKTRRFEIAWDSEDSAGMDYGRIAVSA